MLRPSVYAKRHILDDLACLYEHPDDERGPFLHFSLSGFDQVSRSAWSGGHQRSAISCKHEHFQFSSPCVCNSPLRRPPHTLGSSGLSPGRPEPMLSDGLMHTTLLLPVRAV